MDNQYIDSILQQINEGKRCYCGYDYEEIFTVLAIEKNEDNSYSYRYSIRDKYDMQAPTHYDNRILNEDELRAALRELPAELFENISYTYNDPINENTRETIDLIYWYLRQAQKEVYIVFKEDRFQKSASGNVYRDFNSLFKHREDAERMLDYLSNIQHAECTLRSVILTLANEELQIQADLDPLERLTPRQILVTLLDMNTEQIKKFFED